MIMTEENLKVYIDSMHPSSEKERKKLRKLLKEFWVTDKDNGIREIRVPKRCNIPFLGNLKLTIEVYVMKQDWLSMYMDYSGLESIITIRPTMMTQRCSSLLKMPMRLLSYTTRKDHTSQNTFGTIQMTYLLFLTSASTTHLICT